jgi:putative hydrolase of the HAD superfamily
VRAESRICVTFDLWETLVIDESEWDLARRKLRCEGLRLVLSRAGIDLRMEELLRGYDESAHWLMIVWKDNHETTTADQIRHIIRAASRKTETLPDDPQLISDLEEAYVRPVLILPPRLNSDVIPTLSNMQGRVRSLGIVSNTGRTPGRILRQLLRQLGIHEFFTVTVFSDEVGWRKPDRRIFARAAEMLGVESSSILHIGDNPEADVWGAKQAGMRALLLEYEVPESFKAQAGSLLALTRSTRRIDDSEIKPDGKIRFLSEALHFMDQRSVSA